jgi:hypothetical protein
MRRRDTIDDLRKQGYAIGDADQPCRFHIKAALAEIAAGKRRFRRIGRALTSQQEV